jgi:hypothetical protein
VFRHWIKQLCVFLFSFLDDDKDERTSGVPVGGIVTPDRINVSSIRSGIYIDRRTLTLRRKGHTLLPCAAITQLRANIMITRHPWQSTAPRVMIIVGSPKRLRDRIDRPKSRGWRVIRHSASANRSRGNALLLRHKHVTAKT